MRRLHFYAGLLIAPFLLIAAITGGLYAASYQIEKMLYADELSVPASDSEVPLSVQLEAAQSAYPEGELSTVRTAPEPGDTTRVMFDHPSVDADRKLAVFVDPHTAEVQGALESYGGSGALPFRAWVSELHRNLHLGEVGRVYSELAASWLWVVVLGGVFLWLGRRRKQRKLRGTTGGRRVLSLHGTVGLWAALALVFLAATGMTWSKYAGANIGELRAGLGGGTPVISVDPGDGHAGHGDANQDEGSGGDGEHGEHAEHGEHSEHGESGGESGTQAHPDLGIDQIVKIARSDHGIGGPLEITTPVPGPDGVPTAYVVAELDPQVPQRMDQIALDTSSGELTDRLDFADYPVLAKLSSWGISAHQGQLFGLANQAFLVLLAGSLVTLIVLGYRMWWRRRPEPDTRLSFGRPYDRGALRKLPVTWWLPLAALTLLVGWFMPLLGLSLLAFLTVDVVLGALARRRVTAAKEASR